MKNIPDCINGKTTVVNNSQTNTIKLLALYASVVLQYTPTHTSILTNIDAFNSSQGRMHHGILDEG